MLKMFKHTLQITARHTCRLNAAVDGLVYYWEFLECTVQCIGAGAGQVRIFIYVYRERKHTESDCSVLERLQWIMFLLLRKIRISRAYKVSCETILLLSHTNKLSGRFCIYKCWWELKGKCQLKSERHIPALKCVIPASLVQPLWTWTTLSQSHKPEQSRGEEKCNVIKMYNLELLCWC